jgi:transcriptional regulator with XRE-family HTH domain
MIGPGGSKMADANPTARQRELSRQLRILREAKGLAVTDVADRLLTSPTKIARIETAARKASLRDVRDLCQLYEVTEAETAQLMDLARVAREPGWWARYDDLGNAEAYLGLEQEAKSVTYYSMTFVYGLLQTEGYARSIVRSINPLMNDQVLKERWKRGSVARNYSRARKGHASGYFWTRQCYDARLAATLSWQPS